MHRIHDAVVRGGKLVLSHLPFADGQHVRVLVSETETHSEKLSIIDVRARLKGGAEQFEDPLGSMIPVDDWEMLK